MVSSIEKGHRPCKQSCSKITKGDHLVGREKGLVRIKVSRLSKGARREKQSGGKLHGFNMTVGHMQVVWVDLELDDLGLGSFPWRKN